MSSKPVLNVAPCSRESAKYAVENWHYSRSLPVGKLVTIGAWEGTTYIGAIVFGYGANHNIGKPYRLKQTEVCELVRVALRKHAWPVSRILRFALKILRDSNPGIRLVVSYADTGQEHYGGIYQASGWIYCGYYGGEHSVIVNGRKMHRRQAYSLYGTTRPSGSINIPASGKHKYLMPLDPDIRQAILPLSKPYPKRVGSIANDVPAIHAGEGGVTPTPTLHLSDERG